MNMALGIGIYLAIYREVHDQGRTIPFPSRQHGYHSTHSDTFQDVLSKMETFAALNPDKCGGGKAFNAADGQTVSWAQVWPALCKHNCLLGTGPVENSQPMEEFAKQHRRVWVALAQKQGLDEELVDSHGWSHTHFMLVNFDFERDFDSPRARSVGFAEEVDTVDGFAPETHSELRSRGTVYCGTAKACLKNELDNLSVENVQACVLISNYCGIERMPELEAFYVGMACRTALITQLYEPRAGDDDIQREVRIRIWWSLYMMDRWGSAGQQLPRQLQDRNIDCIPLPMDELTFSSLRGGSRLEEVNLPRPGLWGQMVQLAEIFTMIHDLHRARANGCKTHQETEWRTYELAEELDSWRHTLSLDLLPTEENLRRHAQRGLGSVFVALHMGFYHYTNLLYFPFLDFQLEKTPTQILFSNRCRDAAADFSDFLGLSDEIDGCEVVYFIVAHMTSVSSAALLHVLLFGHEMELPLTRKRLERNFKTLVKLRGYWPAVNQLMERLFTFQRACMRSTDPNTHKADSWMIGFLLDHARPVSERVGSLEGIDPPTVNMEQRDKVATDTMSLLRV